MGKLDDLLPLLLLHFPLGLQAGRQLLPHGLQGSQCLGVFPHLRPGKIDLFHALFLGHLPGDLGQAGRLPGQKLSGAVGAPHHRSHQQQNAQNAVHRLHIWQLSPQRRGGVGHGIVKLQQTDRSVLQF